MVILNILYIKTVQVTGASVQVASEMLPNSTERAVTISGNSEAVIQCIYHICVIMSEVHFIIQYTKNTLRALLFAFVWSSALISGLSQFQCWMSINISHSGQNLFEQSLSNIWTLLSIFCLIQFPSLERVHYCEMKSINPQSLISQQSTLWEVLADTLYTTKIIQNIKLSIADHYLIDF